MSKHITPEVGDVWRHKKDGELLHIIKVGSNFITFIGFTDLTYPHRIYHNYFVNSFSSFDNDPRYTHFEKNWEYLGKSKANIDDLFKTENEE